METDRAAELIHIRVSRSALERPRDLAVVHMRDRLTYGGLERAASQRAEQLRATGVGPGDIVPLSMPRSIDLVIELLAILKCGGTYASLDHKYPTSRRDELRSQMSEADDARTAIEEGHAPACLLSTSGTASEPKAVLLSHRATTRLFKQGPLCFGPGWCMPHHSSNFWDAALLEIWGMLTTGGTSVIVPDEYLLPHRLRQMVRDHGVNTIWLTSSLFNVFVDADVGAFGGLRQVVVGGEPLSPMHIRKFLEAHSDVPIFNGYGPVESCVFATTHRISLEDCDRPSGIPLGRAVSKTGVLVVEGGREVPVGEQGQIAITGDGLAIGYLQDRRLTEEKFTEVNGVRAYLTGDMGVVDDGGVLHFCGRSDRQVKVRGCRVEPAEIEDVVRKVPGIRNCVAVPVPGRRSGYERLAMFYVADSEIDVRDAARRLVPKHMVPDVVRRVPTIPLGWNGKVDSRALLALLT